MISVWWLLVAFVGGGWAGMLLMALMRMSADLPEQSVSLPHLGRAPSQADRFGMVDGFRHIQAPRFSYGPAGLTPWEKALTPLNQKMTAKSK